MRGRRRAVIGFKWGMLRRLAGVFASACKKHNRRIELSVIAVGIVVAGWWAVHVDAFEQLAHFVADHDSWQLDEVIIILLFSGVAAFILMVRRAHDLSAEVTRRQEAELHATSLARHDALTGMPNRRVLIEDLQSILETLAVSGGECAVFLLDLDLFKPVNDVYGHATGDAVLVEVAKRITRALGSRGSVARMGGDEFACVLCCPTGSEMPKRVAAKLIRSLSQPILIGDKLIQVGATIGIALAPQDGTVANELLHGADLAMYDAKRLGKGCYRFFDADMDLKLRARSALEVDLREALVTGQIVPHFQPIIALRTNRILGFEALARWTHPTKGEISPDTFIQIAEDLCIIDELSYSMLRTSCLVARHWPASIWLSVNISPSQLKDASLSTRLLAILAETEFDPRRLVIEVTENSIIQNIGKAREVFQALQLVGVRIALDDFGKGYSSLFHLRQLQFDHLKIDGSFVHSMGAPESMKIIGAIANLGKSLSMPVTAEGVETSAEVDALRAMGCEHGQGYYFGKALDPAEIDALIARRGGRFVGTATAA